MDKKIRKQTRKILDDLKIDKIYLGYFYWISLVDECNKRGGFTIKNLTMEDYYEIVAKKNNTSRTKVERDLRTALYGRKDDISKYFNYYYKITNKSFLILILDKIRYD